MFLRKLRGYTFCIAVLVFGLGCQSSRSAESKTPDAFLLYNDNGKVNWAISADSREVAFVIEHGIFDTLQVRDLATGALVAKKELRARVGSLWFRTDGQVVFATYSDGHQSAQQFHLWNPKTNAVSIGGTGQWRTLSPDGKRVIVTSHAEPYRSAQKFALIDKASGRMLTKLPAGSIYAFSCDSRYLAVSYTATFGERDYRAVLELWDAARTGKRLFSGPGGTMEYSPHISGARIAGLVFAGQEIVELTSQSEGDASIISDAYVSRWKVQDKALKHIKDSDKTVEFRLDKYCEDVELNADGSKMYAAFLPDYMEARKTSSFELIGKWGVEGVHDEAREVLVRAFSYGPALLPTPDGRKIVVLKPTEIRIEDATSGKLLIHFYLTPPTPQSSTR